MCVGAQDDIETLSKLVELVETTIDLDQLDSHRTVIKPDFDEELQKINKKLVKTRDSINGMNEEVAEDLGMQPKKGKSPLNFENHQVYGHCFRLTRKVGCRARFPLRVCCLYI